MNFGVGLGSPQRMAGWLPPQLLQACMCCSWERCSPMCSTCGMGAVAECQPRQPLGAVAWLWRSRLTPGSSADPNVQVGIAVLSTLPLAVRGGKAQLANLRA